jgi:Domain of unknown function (DUF4189)
MWNSFTKLKRPVCSLLASIASGEGNLTRFIFAARRRVIFTFGLSLALFASLSAESARAAGAFAVGKCGAYGQAIDYAAQDAALAAAKKQCQGDCTTVVVNRACAALAVDMKNPCGAHGYAVAPRISSSLNAATKKCYDFGGKECVIRAWACDAKG